MSRIMKMKVKQPDGSFSDYIDFGAKSINVTMKDGSTLQENIDELLKNRNYKIITDLDSESTVKVPTAEYAKILYETLNDDKKDVIYIQMRKKEDSDSYDKITYYGKANTTKLISDSYSIITEDPDLNNNDDGYTKLITTEYIDEITLTKTETSYSASQTTTKVNEDSLFSFIDPDFSYKEVFMPVIDSQPATKGYVDSKGYVTEEYVNSKNYATESFVESKGYITKDIDNLDNYYNKTNSYSKGEVNDLIGALTGISISVVDKLPTSNISTTTIYLVPKEGTNPGYGPSFDSIEEKLEIRANAEMSGITTYGTAGDLEGNIYDEYLYVNNKWELIGSTEVDLTGYAKIEEASDESDALVKSAQNPTTLYYWI